MSRVLITGASGNLGRSMMLVFGQHPQYQTEGWALNRIGEGLNKVDLLQPAQVLEALNNFKPDVIIHCAAETRPDVVANNKEMSLGLNVESTRIMANYAVCNNCYMVHISTDYVFDGTSPPYSEDSMPNPLNEYGVQKLEAEKVVQQIAGNQAAILRVPVLFGQSEYIGETAVDTLLKPLLDQSKNVKIDDYATRYPTNTMDIADAVVFLVRKRAQDASNVHGIYHWSSDKPMTKWDMVKIMAQALDLPYDHLTGDKCAPIGPVTRPKDASLSCKKMLNLGMSTNHRYLADCAKKLFTIFVTSPN